MKNKNAQELAKERWKGTTQEERSETMSQVGKKRFKNQKDLANHLKKMLQARRDKIK